MNIQQSKKGLAWRFIVLLILGLAVLFIVLYAGLWRNLPIVREIIYGLQNMF